VDEARAGLEVGGGPDGSADGDLLFDLAATSVALGVALLARFEGSLPESGGGRRCWCCPCFAPAA
jgi:hypothetical protein